MGGGAGYVYIGAAARLRAEGLSLDYLVGAPLACSRDLMRALAVLLL